MKTILALTLDFSTVARRSAVVIPPVCPCPGAKNDYDNRPP